MSLWKGFKRKEFACKCGCGFDAVDAELLIVLKELKEHFSGRAVILNCACRCPKHNAKVGGKPKSQHLFGKAADVRVKGILPSIVADYLESKYTDMYGIGRYQTFTHIDVRPNKARWG